MARKVAILPPLFAIVAVALALVVVGLWPSGQAAASGHSATRSLAPSAVAPGEEITVTIRASNYGDFGQVVETLPEGFSYVPMSSDIRARTDGQKVRFSLLGENKTVSYRVTASEMSGSYTFNGILRDGVDAPASEPISGDAVVTVTAGEGQSPEPTPTSAPTEPTERGATRSLPTALVAPGGEFTVSIAANYGDFGKVTETLPDGFDYVTDSVDPSSVRAAVDGQAVGFTLLGDTTFSYMVTASRVGGSHSFEGTLSDDEGNSHRVSGASQVSVDAPVPTAIRGLPSRVSPGGDATVTITVGTYGSFGQVVETLPEGFAYVADSVSPSEVRVGADSQVLTFTLLGPDQSFSYKVNATSSTGSHTFSGFLSTDQEGVQVDVGGDSSITVSTPTTTTPSRPSRPRAPASRNRAPSFEEGSSATRSISENSVAGTAVGDPIAATDRDDDDIVYSLVGGDTELFEINKSNGQLLGGRGRKPRLRVQEHLLRQRPSHGRRREARQHHRQHQGHRR